MNDRRATDEPGTPRELSGVAVRSVLWQGLSLVSGRGFTLVATVVLARLLSPADFGLVGLALVFITFAEYATDLGVAQALVYFERDARNEDTALVLDEGYLSETAEQGRGAVRAGRLLLRLGREDAPPRAAARVDREDAPAARARRGRAGRHGVDPQPARGSRALTRC